MDRPPPPLVGTFGELEGLPSRIAAWINRLSSPALPWAGLGLIKDLQMVMRFLSLREFGEFLRSRAGIDSEWGDEIIAAADAADELEQLQTEIEEAVPVAEGQEYQEAIANAAKLGDRVRDVLVEVGALSADDTTTDIPALVRALLA